MSRRAGILAALVLQGGSAAAQPFAVGGDPRVDPDAFEITTFAAGLDFPFGLALLQDGSLLVGINTPPTGQSYFAATGRLVRFADGDGDGVADGPGSTLYTGLPGFTTSVRRAGALVFAATGAPNPRGIFVLRQGATPASPLSLVGSLSLTYPAAWSHSTVNLCVREAPGQPGLYELYFNLGSKENAAASSETIAVGGLVSGSAHADSLYRVTIDDTGPALAAFGLEQIAGGLRNAFGAAFEPQTGDLILQDNGIDGLIDVNEPLSADELNRIPAAALGGAIEDFGFPDRYVAYRTGALIGSGGIDPFLAFQPIPLPGGAEAEGAVDVVFAPPQFPPGLRDGVFVGFHGRFASAGLANEENPLVYVDLDPLAYFHFVSSSEPGIGHPDTLAASADALYLADLTSANGFASAGSGAIYRIRALPGVVPALGPGALALLALGLGIAALPFLARLHTRRSRGRP